MPRPPTPRGPLSAWVCDLGTGRRPGRVPPFGPATAFDDDFQLALYLAQEVHFSDVPGFVPALDADVSLLRVRTGLETAWMERLRLELPERPRRRDVREDIRRCIEEDCGPSLSLFVEQRGTLALVREVVKQRSAYQLKEGDAHTMAVPHLRGRAKQQLARIQAGEYGVDGPDAGRRMHAALFAATMASLRLDARLHAYLDELLPSALAISTLVSTLGMNRSRRGALVGHLAAFELTSVEPMRRYATALRRLGALPVSTRFYDVHVLADAEHERVALDMAASLVADVPDLYGAVVLGVQCVLLTERNFAADLLAHPLARAAEVGRAVAA